MRATTRGFTEIVKLLLEQEGIDINSKSDNMFFLMFISIIFYLIIIFGICSNCLKQHLFVQLIVVELKLLNCFLNKKESIYMLKLFICLIQCFFQLFSISI